MRTHDVVFGLVLILSAAAVHAQPVVAPGGYRFEDLGTLSDDPAEIVTAAALSRDGRVVVGKAGVFGYHWTPEVGMVALPVPEGAIGSAATAVSADGSVIAGRVSMPDRSFAVVWDTPDSAPRELAGLALAGLPIGMSDDGRFIFGNTNILLFGGFLPTRPVRWTDGGPPELLVENGEDIDITLGAVSADGRVAVGSFGRDGAYRWAEGQPLQRFPGIGANSYLVPAAGSADLSVWVGRRAVAPSVPPEPFRRAGGVVEGLGFLPGRGFSLRATAASADARIIAGGNTPFLWTELSGLVDVVEAMADRGVEFAGWAPFWVSGLSDDGLVLVGHGRVDGERRAWRLTLPDRDSDGFNDLVDSCPEDPDPEPQDRDGDGLADACDAYPGDANHEAATCYEALANDVTERTAAESELAECVDLLVDADGDGERDLSDACPGTGAGDAIDDAGCSRSQFCEAIPVAEWIDFWTCMLSDWGNDEHRRIRPRDCNLERSEEGWRCVAR